MKRFFLISIMLLLIGAVYADGPRFRFKSRRALQTLWRNEMKENPNASGSAYRKMSARELQGENADEMKKAERVYGVAAANPFEETMGAVVGDGEGTGSGSGFGGNTGSGLPGAFDPNKTDNGEHLIGKPGTGGPYIGGSTTSGQGQGYCATPYPPVGDGIHILLIFTAALIAIKKRLSD